MSLSLLQGYSSEEENGPGAPEDDVSPGREIDNCFPLSSDGEEEGGRRQGRAGGKGNDKSIFDHPKNLSSNSLLPSAFDVFSEVAGPPDFLNNSVREEEKASKKNGGAEEGVGNLRETRKISPQDGAREGVIFLFFAQALHLHNRPGFPVHDVPHAGRHLLVLRCLDFVMGLFVVFLLSKTKGISIDEIVDRV